MTGKVLSNQLTITQLLTELYEWFASLKRKFNYSYLTVNRKIISETEYEFSVKLKGVCHKISTPQCPDYHGVWLLHKSGKLTPRCPIQTGEDRLRAIAEDRLRKLLQTAEDRIRGFLQTAEDRLSANAEDRLCNLLQTAEDRLRGVLYRLQKTDLAPLRKTDSVVFFRLQKTNSEVSCILQKTDLVQLRKTDSVIFYRWQMTDSAVCLKIEISSLNRIYI